MFNRESYIESSLEIERELLLLFEDEGAKIIFDIGACEGEDSIRYSKLFPDSKIYSFEPRLDNCEIARSQIKKYGRVNIVLENIALSDKNGTADLYISEGNPTSERNDNWNYGNKSSSLLPPTEELLRQMKWLEFKKKITVPTSTLIDYVTTKGIETIDIAHIDVQGAELMVLKGAGNFLRKIKVIWLEVEKVELYKQQALKSEIENFFAANNFVNIFDTVKEISGDQLYVNKNYFNKKKISRARRQQPGLFGKLKSGVSRLFS